MTNHVGADSLKARDKLRSIQAMRAIAALWVALFHHAQFFQNSGGTDWAYNFFKAGWGGVYIFFVLSGFIIWHLTNEEAEVRTFAISRLTRIYCSLWPAVALFCLIAYVGQVGRPMSFLGVWNSFTLLDPDPRPETSYLYLTWTLTYELVFYVGFALLLVTGRQHAVLYAVAAIMVVEAGRFAEAVIGVEVPRLFSDRIFYAFLIGCAAASIVSRPLPRAMPVFALVVAVALFGLGTYLSGWHQKHNMILFFGGGCFAFLVGHGCLEPFLKNWVGAALSKLGDASYAIYLLHPSVLYLSMYGNFRGRVAQDYGIWLETCLFVGAVIVSSLVFHQLIERPLLSWSRNRLQPRARILEA